MPGRRAAARERTSSALKKKATVVKRPTYNYNQRAAANRNARTVTQAKRSAGVAPTPKKPTVQSWLRNTFSSLGRAASATGQSFQTAAQRAGEATARAYNTAIQPALGGFAPRIPIPQAPRPSHAIGAPAGISGQEWLNRQYAREGNVGLGEIGRKAILPQSPEGYTEPLGPGYSENPASYYGYNGGAYPGYTGYNMSYPDYGSGGVYAQPGGGGVNPSRGNAQAWWRQLATWRF